MFLLAIERKKFREEWGAKDESKDNDDSDDDNDGCSSVQTTLWEREKEKE